MADLKEIYISKYYFRPWQAMNKKWEACRGCGKKAVAVIDGWLGCPECATEKLAPVADKLAVANENAQHNLTVLRAMVEGKKQTPKEQDNG